MPCKTGIAKLGERQIRLPTYGGRTRSIRQTFVNHGWSSERRAHQREGFLNYSPRLGAILFVVARSFIHDGRPVATPNW
jgi:hypothetical protein